VQATRSSEIKQYRNWISRPWRIGFVLFAIALTIGTHWPRLEFGPEIPATDKTIHLLAFGSATILLRLTGWIRNGWLCGGIVWCWAFFDELSQNLPGLGRSSHPHDMIANTLGILVACAWLWALEPLGAKFAEGDWKDGPNRLRLRAFAFSFDQTFAKRGPWVAGIGAALCGAAALAATWVFLPLEGKRIAIVGSVVLAALVALHFWWRQWRAELHRDERQKPCTSCGSDEAPVDDRCPRCASFRSPSLWTLPKAPARALAFKLTLRPTIIAMTVLLLGFAAILIAPLFYSMLIEGNQRSSSSIFAMRFARMLGTMPRELTSIVDLSLYLLLFAISMRIYRKRLAKFYDSAVICMRCGHDLRGTPTAAGIGHCGECGAVFTRARN
jgi:hypothetical protein